MVDTEAAQLIKQVKANNRHIVFSMVLLSVIIFILVAVGLQSRYGWPVGFAVGVYILCAVVIVAAHMQIYWIPRHLHGK